MTELTKRDYFADFDILRDPYPYFEAIHTEDGVFHDEERDIYFVTGFDPVVQSLLDSDRLSSGIAVFGAKDIPKFGQDGADVRTELAEFRKQHPMFDLLVNYDGQEHSNVRSLLSRLFTPSRIKSNEEYMARLADEMVAEAVSEGKAEMVKGIAAPYVTLVIADLLGVPADDREKFREVIDKGPPAGNMTENDERSADATLIYLGGFFMRYITERKAQDMGDVMSELAHASFPDGTTPDILEVVKASMFLFAAGQDTSAKLVANSVRYLAENPAMQDHLRDNPSDLVPFIEEMLRLEGSTKATFRLALDDVKVGDTIIPAGKPMVITLAAANRDPAKWEQPAEFRLDRKKGNQHVSFGRGRHTCIGAALARAEVKFLLETLLRETTAIVLDETIHGDPQDRQLTYEPSYIIRGLEELHVRIEGKR
ncbi:cytochrome P450 [Parasphingorhabdus sp.]|uniref:cytochrome P450 n=1 Tax=Parasphingorhabdus sp. TaxID=2709688 RepID=UPI003A93EA14